MKKFLSLFLLLSGVILAANSCSTPAPAPVAPATNEPSTFSVTQTPVPAPTPAPVVTPPPTTVSTTSAPSNPTQPVTTPPPAPTPTPAPVPAPKPVTPPAAVKVQVNIQNFAFNPAVVTINVGDTVVWTNNDPVPHQIASASFNSSPLSQGSSFSQKFMAAGTYDYHCAIHPSMTGQIIVK